MNNRRRQPTVMYEKSTTPEGDEYPIRPLGDRYLPVTSRGSSPPAIPVQSLRDWLQARCLHHKELDPRFRGYDIHTCIHLPGCADIEDEFGPITLSLTLALSPRERGFWSDFRYRQNSSWPLHRQAHFLHHFLQILPHFALGFGIP